MLLLTTHFSKSLPREVASTLATKPIFVYLFATFFVVYSSLTHIRQSVQPYIYPILKLFVSTTLDSLDAVIDDQMLSQLHILFDEITENANDEKTISETTAKNETQKFFYYFLIKFGNILGFEMIEFPVTEKTFIYWIGEPSAYFWIWIHIITAIENVTDKINFRTNLLCLLSNLDIFILCGTCSQHYLANKWQALQYTILGKSLLTIYIDLHAFSKLGLAKITNDEMNNHANVYPQLVESVDHSGLLRKTLNVFESEYIDIAKKILLRNK